MTLYIQIGTHADSLIAEAVLKNISSGFDLDLAWEAVWKDVTVAPENDGKTRYEDREEVRTLIGPFGVLSDLFVYPFQNVDFEVRAGLSSVYNDPSKGWVADNVHSESASRTLAYACTSFLRLFSLHEMLNPILKSTTLQHTSSRTP